MIKITEAAWARLTQLQAKRPGMTAVRLTHKDGQIKCRRGVPKKLDRTVEHDGSPTLLMTPDVAKELSGSTLDAPETERGRRLRLKRISR